LIDRYTGTDRRYEKRKRVKQYVCVCARERKKERKREENARGEEGREGRREEREKEREPHVLT